MVAATSPDMKGFFRNRFIRAILLSGLFLQIGIWVRNFSVLLFVMEQTNEDPFAVSMISVAEFAPIFLFSFIGGAFADRWRPKRTMIWCDILSALSVFAVLLALVFGTWKAVFFATLVSAILSQFSQPAGMKLFKLHVSEDLMQIGMSMYQTLFAVFMILGPILGTFVYQNYGIHVAIGVTGVAFLLSAGVLLFLPRDREVDEAKAPSGFWKEVGLGFRYVLSSTLLTTLGACFLVAGFAIGFIHPLGIFIVTEQLNLPKEFLQWFMTVNGAAMIVGGGLAMGFSKKLSPPKMLALGMAVNALGIMIIGVTPNVWLSLAGQFMCGLFLPCIHIGINTMILQNTEEAFVGRVNGILNPMFMGAMVVTMSVAGWLKGLLPLVVIYGLSGVLFIVGTVIIVPLFRLSADRKSQEHPG